MANLKKVSEYMESEIVATEKEMKTRMAAAGAKEYKSTKVKIPIIYGSPDDVLSVGLNGQSFYFRRGTTVNMPDPLVEILERNGHL